MDVQYVRTLHQQNIDVLISSLFQIQPTVACTKAHMKMNFCPHCRGLPSLKPCANYCLNVMKGCLAYHSELNANWFSYVGECEGSKTA